MATTESIDRKVDDSNKTLARERVELSTDSREGKINQVQFHYVGPFEYSRDESNYRK